MSLCRNSTTGEFWRLGARGDVGGNPVEFVTGSVTNGQGDTAANTTTGFVSGTWYHACGVEYASNSRAVFINGGSKGTGSTTVTPVSVNDAYIGAYKYGGFPIEAYLNGMVAEAGWWNRALDDAEVALLARGKRPSEIRPGALVEYVPQIRGLDSYKRNGWTGNNGLALTQHPPLWARRSRVFAGTSPPPPPPSTYIGARFQMIGSGIQQFSGGRAA